MHIASRIADSGKSEFMRAIISKYSIEGCSEALVNTLSNTSFAEDGSSHAVLHMVCSCNDFGMTTSSGGEFKGAAECDTARRQFKGGSRKAPIKHAPYYISSNLCTREDAKREIESHGLKSTWTLAEYDKVRRLTKFFTTYVA